VSERAVGIGFSWAFGFVGELETEEQVQPIGE